MTKAISFPPQDRLRFDNDRYFDEQKVNLLNNCRFIIWFYMQVLYSGKRLACIFTILVRKTKLVTKTSFWKPFWLPFRVSPPKLLGSPPTNGSR